ncbi:MAG: bifunctional 3-deoxy-7-phosphoheptulonate synthase/chorismate mutase type II [Desulfobacteraceae bacterium]|nr:bifunctional 3-deoxy-7-phosphoheptulonate synthase/chorismate mutase type II [Desulfobacteraceae bacterium]
MMDKLDIIPMKAWASPRNENCLIIAGPCSAETRDQVFQTAKEIQKSDRVDFFRAGVWKPRTRPGGFEGAGIEALEWLKEARAETGIKIAVEAANSRHVEQCLKYDVDVLWIGTRTTANPFSIQEIADALKGVDIPVLIKNPMNPDLPLWIGAIERIHKAGIRKLAAIHRGFFPFERTHLRNIPKWEVVIELKSRFHNLPIICDPSHICGNSAYVEKIAQKALDINLNGLMIESHIKPEKALSDSAQQVTPDHLESILANLKHRVVEIEDSKFKDALTDFRGQIDDIDYQMTELMGERMDLVRQIAREKWKRNISVLQLKHWENMQKTRIEHARERELSDTFIKKIFQLVHKESISIQTDVMHILNKEKQEKKDTDDGDSDQA